MKVYAKQFNLYLPLLAAILLICGCASHKDKDKDKDAFAVLRIHIETTKNMTGTGRTVDIIRSNPVSMAINDQPIITEENVIGARMINTVADGYAVEIKLDEEGTFTLEQFSAANPGWHFAIFGQWGKKAEEGRWLAAPLITKRITIGELIFTPDASREETQKFIAGLDKIAKANIKATSKE